mmetsp:Transcript_45750/g.76086  ORF Transcript_45750/g.76086 Transcript_45750/m.76086 type:complete len:203 (-) Transcript_45750:426-1034(-)
MYKATLVHQSPSLTAACDTSSLRLAHQKQFPIVVQHRIQQLVHIPWEALSAASCQLLLLHLERLGLHHLCCSSRASTTKNTEKRLSRDPACLRSRRRNQQYQARQTATVPYASCCCPVANKAVVPMVDAALAVALMAVFGLQTQQSLPHCPSAPSTDRSYRSHYTPPALGQTFDPNVESRSFSILDGGASDSRRPNHPSSSL